MDAQAVSALSMPGSNMPTSGWVFEGIEISILVVDSLISVQQINIGFEFASLKKLNILFYHI